ncbi:MAG: hypothetical protein EP330_00605 [Deltaproteobacteria bacterium]|nr:MAG: hypothetical protein EP330_00605 [Deltaproteobacteria bacterium]
MSFFSKLLQRLAPDEPEPPDEDERELFALRIQAILAAAGHPGELDLENFSLRFEDGAVAYLGNRFGAFTASEDEREREAMLVDIAEGIIDIQSRPQPPETWEEAAPRLLVRLRPKTFSTVTRLRFMLDGFEGPFPEGPTIPVSQDLVLELVLDMPRAIMSLGREQLDDWGVSADEAFSQAVDNLRDSEPSPFVEVTTGVYAAQVGDCYDSGRLVLLDQIRELPLVGDPVVLPANRDTLVITGEDDPAGLSILLDVAVQASQQPRLDTLQPVVLRPEGYEDWWPHPSHRLAAAWGELAVRNRGSAYAEIKDLLEATWQRGGVDRFMASFGAVQLDETARPLSYSMWAPVDGMLPEADLVNIISPDEQHLALFVPWTTLMDVAGDQLEREVDVWPPVYRFRGGPDPQTFEVLAAHAREVKAMSEMAG